jgi:hypothetical protein
VPPWAHSELAFAANATWPGVSATVTAPASASPVSSPLRSRSGTLDRVTMSPANGPVTTDSAPHGPVTARDV